MKTPKVFISHSWDDKDRFVLSFAEKLRLKGVDAWVDKWEMLPGDSLIKKVFYEGIQDANAFIIVLSGNSVDKKWVQEELDIAFIKKIEKGCRIIPVIIDDCVVPPPLKSTVWTKIQDLNNYDTELENILMAIYGKTNKPPIGKPPKYVNESLISFNGLSTIDSLIFEAICKKAIHHEREFDIHGTEIFSSLSDYDIKEDIFNESLTMLTHENLIKIRGYISKKSLINLTDFGIEKYISECVPSFFDIEQQVICELVNFDSSKTNLNFAGINSLFLHYVLRNLSNRRLITYNRTLGGTAIIQGISPLLRRLANDTN